MLTSIRFKITFTDKGTTASAIRNVPASMPAAMVLMVLRLAPYSGTIVLHVGAGSMSQEIEKAAQELFIKGLVPVAEKRQLLVIDGGTESGGMRAMGNARRGSGSTFPLLGICPQGPITFSGKAFTDGLSVELNASHSHFVFVEGDNFGDESDLIVDTLHGSGKPGVVMVVGGGNIVHKEVVLHAQKGNSLIVVRNSGGTADKLLDPEDDIHNELPEKTHLDVVDLDDPQKLSELLEKLLVSG